MNYTFQPLSTLAEAEVWERNDSRETASGKLREPAEREREREREN